jgi:ATP-dependent DNA helicase DinG
VIPSPPFPAPDTQDFAKEVANTIITVCQQTAGGVMGLFTSYKNLNQVRELVGPALGLRKLYVQGEMPKGRIIEHFKKDFEDGHRALILATASFWQGVDIPGQALSVVVIDKIPFARPDDPVMHYLERIEENAFFDYSVPKAIIALKQGVGRLIRRESDFGCVVILDTRLRTKNYKKTVLSALPAGCFISDNLDHVASFIADHS